MYYTLVVQRFCFVPRSTDSDLNYCITICFLVVSFIHYWTI